MMNVEAKGFESVVVAASIVVVTSVVLEIVVAVAAPVPFLIDIEEDAAVNCWPAENMTVAC